MSACGRSWCRLPLWYGGGLAAAIVVGWAAASLHAAGHAPLGIVPLVVGIVLGASLILLAARFELHCPKQLLVGTVLLALIAVLSEHAWLYREFRRQWHESRAQSPEVALFRSEAPWSPSEYFAREIEAGSAALWSLDAAIVVSAAVATVLVVRRTMVKRPTASGAALSDL
jgi:hypothetical protein